MQLISLIIRGTETIPVNMQSCIWQTFESGLKSIFGSFFQRLFVLAKKDLFVKAPVEMYLSIKRGYSIYEEENILKRKTGN